MSYIFKFIATTSYFSSSLSTVKPQSIHLIICCKLCLYTCRPWKKLPAVKRKQVLKKTGQYCFTFWVFETREQNVWMMSEFWIYVDVGWWLVDIPTRQTYCLMDFQNYKMWNTIYNFMLVMQNKCYILKGVLRV